MLGPLGCGTGLAVAFSPFDILSDERVRGITRAAVLTRRTQLLIRRPAALTVSSMVARGVSSLGVNSSVGLRCVRRSMASAAFADSYASLASEDMRAAAAGTE
jgi:hypothetical protein